MLHGTMPLCRSQRLPLLRHTRSSDEFKPSVFPPCVASSLNKSQVATRPATAENTIRFTLTSNRYCMSERSPLESALSYAPRCRRAILLLCVVACFGFSTSSVAQTSSSAGLSEAKTAKIGFRLQPVVKTATQAKQDQRLPAYAAKPFRGVSKSSSAASPAATYEVFIHTDNASLLKQEGLAIDSRFDGFVTARVTAEQIGQLAQMPDVRRVRSSGEARLDNDEAAGFIGARALNDGFVEGTSYTGQGVLACVIDTGIDYDHPDFVDDNGNSRILSIWDQTFDTDGQTPYDQSPMLFDSQGAFDYGTEYLHTDIGNGTASTTDTNGHGTHVAGTVGANGRAGAAGRHAGMAPGVEFIIIRAGSGRSLSAKGAVDGLSYCDKVADREGKPMVANKSLGSQAGPHDGTSEWAQAVDQVIEDGQKAGRAVVIAAGNSGQHPIHILDVVASGSSRVLDLAVTPYTPNSGPENDVVVPSTG